MNRAKPLIRTVAAALSLLAAAAAGAAESGALLLQGGDFSHHETPPALQGIEPEHWPAAGWMRIDLQTHGLRVAEVAAPAHGQPEFLRQLVAQMRNGVEPAADDALYLRVPGSTLVQGLVPAHVFRNGTRTLQPLLDHRYALQWRDKPYAFTVQNGLRTADGRRYSEGAVYSIEIDGRTRRYVLPGFGWDSAVQAIADLDGDGEPDFVISVGGSNSSTAAVLLSSQARPGDNPPTATLTSFGC